MRHNPANGKHAGYYRLVESYRNEQDRVCHRTLLNVGFLDGVVSIDQLNLIRRKLVNRYQQALGETQIEFPDEEKVEAEDIVNRFVEDLWEKLVSENRIDVGQKEKKRSSTKDKELVYVDTLRHKDIREIGSEWLCYQALEQLGVSNFLAYHEWEEKEIQLALTHIISRAVYPASEFKTSRWILENSAVCELTGFPIETITKDQLYKIAQKLYTLKEPIEQYLSSRTNELFDIEDKIILYDLTNTYFEGRMVHSELARFGRSKEKRNDAKIVVLALVVNPEGFIKYSSILEGNMNDAATFEGMINKLRIKTSDSAKKAIVVMDAGIATEANLSLLTEKGYDYICVTRSTLKDYIVSNTADMITVKDNKQQNIVLQKVTSSKNDDYYLKIESEAKKAKECSMNNRFVERFEAGLKQISAGLAKKSGIKQEHKVLERVGRLKQKYPSIQRHYDISYEIEIQVIKKQKGQEPTEKRIVKSMAWQVEKDTDINARSGIYFLRTSLQEAETILWQGYNTIREIEATFRVLKTDLDLRPIYHKKDENTMAHLHLGLLAYWVVNTIRHQLKSESETPVIHSQWKEIVRVMNTQKAVTTTAQNKADEIIQIRRCSEPNDNVKAIYNKLKYKPYPFQKRKFVVHKPELKKSYLPDIGEVRSG
jgi:hypothetical protein